MKHYEIWIFAVLLSITNCTVDWDFLIFSQRWPITACTEWKDHNKNNTCVFPEPTNYWTVHGIWPTKVGTEGPWNCNASWHFDYNILNPIKLELTRYWANIESNTQIDSFWKHEWVKHGTCATTNPLLNNELKYFNQGLKWIQKFNMKNILPSKQIMPNKTEYTVQEIFDAIRLILDKIPVIQCVINRYTKQSLISEIRVCFDKELTLIDCRAVKGFDDFEIVGDILTNCNVSKPIVYPDSVEPYTTTTTNTPSPTVATTVSIPESTWDVLYSTREKLLNIYKSIHLVIWFTF